jgi:molybdenum cofactor synthesis domain-containing protein
MTAPTAAVVVIGNEVLSAKVMDANGPWLLARLRERGVRVTSLCVVADTMDAIVEAVDRERRRNTWVLTTGGIGPTHDDLTLPAIARALGRPLAHSEPLAEAIRAGHARFHPDSPFPEAALRMADIPAGSRLLGAESYPLIAVENLVLFPGPPEFVRFHFERFAEELSCAPFVLACVYVACGEGEIAGGLDRVARANPSVDIGSYPRFDRTSDHRVKVTVESKDRAAVRAVVEAIRGIVPEGQLVRVEGAD